MGSADFYQCTRHSRKVFVADLGFLGDTVHLFPALREIRDAYPQAELHVMSSTHVMDLLRLLPWIDRAWGYPRFPKSPPWHKTLPIIRALRREKFDTVINLNGSNRSSFLTRSTGARHRLGRIPQTPGGALWPWCFTHTVSVPYNSVESFRQRWLCLQQSGFPVSVPRFDVTIPADVRQSVDKLLDHQGGFIHISPFTTQNHREPHPQDLIDFLNTLAKETPAEKVVISCAPNQRETSKLAEILSGLQQPPWKIFQGTLTTIQTCALIDRARVHLGGDSGAVHIATMLGIPNLAWFHEGSRQSNWLPRAANDQILFVPRDDSGFLRVNPARLIEGVLANRQATLNST
ncbi:MAG: glycosyltransferase family 9 protein [Verrucomicrobiales bacterium]|jgi:ADP-heptose:LPS heptosyltransferase|nr:glycosyltransferase family 9 protein [Verrucomicrobiales bacterium]